MCVTHLAVAALFILSTVSAPAAVKTEEKSQVQFPGMLGRMVNLFGGKAARQGITETVAVKGNRKRTVGEDAGQIIDLDEEKVYDLDMRDRSYRVTTFEELRRRMREAQEKAEKEVAKTAGKPAEPSSQPKGQEVQIDFDLKESGQRKAINGFDCREVVMTVAVHEKGKTLEDSGGMVLTSHTWLAPSIAAMKEIGEFDLRYAKKLDMFGSANMEQMAAAMAMYPYMKEALGKFRAENVNMDGTAILTTMTMEGAQSREQAAQQQQQQKSEERDTSTGIPSVGGILGGLGRRAIRKKMEDKSEPESGASKGRSAVMTMNHELLKVSTDVADPDLAIPPGFKQKK